MIVYSKILCFDASSSVKTTNGDFLIKDIVPGMEVFTYDEERCLLIVDTVTAVAKSLHSRCAIVEFEEGVSLKSTVDHPLYVVNKGWCAVDTCGIKEMYGVRVKQLNVGDDCVMFKDEKLITTKITAISERTCSEYFYCLSTKNNHNFFVNGIVAHDVNINRFSSECLIQEGVEVIKSSM